MFNSQLTVNPVFRKGRERTKEILSSGTSESLWIKLPPGEALSLKPAAH